MPAIDTEVQQSSPRFRGPARTRKRKACQRCRSRKQRCNGSQPCQNCVASGTQCAPAQKEHVEMYPVEYVKSLEQHVANLETKLGQYSGNDGFGPISGIEFDSHLMSTASIDAATAPLPMTEPLQVQPVSALDPSQPNANAAPGMPDGLDPDLMGGWPLSFSPMQQDIFHNTAFLEPLMVNAESATFKSSPTSISKVSITTADAANYFQIYFEVIHPRYPFLMVEDCVQAYSRWKLDGFVTDDFQSLWFSFITTMVFGIGSRIEMPHSSRAKRSQHAMLMAKVESVQSIVSDRRASPLIRLQAMLLYVLLAISSDSTSRLAHVSGVAMRFATLHGFHRLKPSGNDVDYEHRVRCWSCVYSIDRMISGTLRVPVCVSESCVSSPLVEGQNLSLWTMPWLLDCSDYDSNAELVDLTTFGHMCRLRQYQGRLMQDAELLKPGEVGGYIESRQVEIEEWINNKLVTLQSQPEDEGFYGALWVQRGRHILEVQLYSTFEEHLYPGMAQKLARACCQTCTVYRTVLKSRQVTQSWIDTVFEFQAGATLLYLMWKRKPLNVQEVEKAIRNCRSILVIWQDSAPAAEFFIDCIDALVSLTSKGVYHDTDPVEYKEEDAFVELQTAVAKTIETGIAPHIADMLLEMSRKTGL